ncbi:MAG TPA: GAF domain-containing protein, partial [Pyrinomonadaceae bacterium]|nr:GAF domain-containing protein [Pyrinomonadaceae bacterium]
MSNPDTDLRRLFELMSDAALVVDEREGLIVAANKAFAGVVEREREELTGGLVASLLAFEADAAGGDTGERASLFAGDGRGWIPVRVERAPVSWDGREASLYVVRRNVRLGEPDGEGLGEEEVRALFDYLQEATEQVEVVNRVVAAVNSSRTIAEVFSLASQQMGTLVPFDRASIALCEGGGERLRVFALSGEHAGSLTVGSLGQMRGSVTELALAERRMIVIPELESETRFNLYEDLRREGFRSAVCVPLFSTHAAVGSLNLTSRTPAAYNRRHLLALERLAPPLAIAIEKILLLEQAERRSREMEAAARREELAGRIGRLLASSLDPSNVLQGAVELLGRALDASRCHVALFEQEAGRVTASVGYEYVDESCEKSLRGRALPLSTSGYAKKILASDEPVAVDDWGAAEAEELTELYKELHVRAALAAPVHPGGARGGGILELHDCRGPRLWTDDDKRLLGAVAAQVSVALTNAELYEAARLRAEELRGLFEISRTFSTLTDTSEISGRLARSIAKLVGGEMCLIATYDRRQNTMRAEAPGYHTPPALVEEFHFRLDRENRDAPLYALAESFLSNDPVNDPRLNRAFVERYHITSVLGVPMRIKRELIGFIYVGNRTGGFRRRDQRMLEIFSAQAAETIVNARLFLTIQAQAEREAVVNRLLLSLQRGGEPKDKIHSVIERVGQVLDLDRCIIVLFAEGEHEDYYGEWCAEGVVPVTHDVEVRERSPIRYALRTARRPLVAADVREHPLFKGLEELVERTQIKSLMVVPIMHLGRVIGSISAHQTRTRRQWAEDDIDLLVAVAT